jgi:hypothetical protein
MRGAIALVLSLTLSGCAAHRAPIADPLHNWASVIAIPRGAFVRVTLGYDVDGRLDDVTDSTLTLGRPAGVPPLTINGAWVVRVEVLAPKKIRWDWLACPLEAGFVGGFVGTVVGAIMRDAKVVARSLGVFTASLIGGLSYISSGAYRDHEWRVVYVRQ